MCSTTMLLFVKCSDEKVAAAPLTIDLLLRALIFLWITLPEERLSKRAWNAPMQEMVVK